MNNSTTFVNISIACHDGQSLFLHIEDILFQHDVKYTCDSDDSELFYLISNVTLNKANAIRNDILNPLDDNTFCLIELIEV